MSETFTTTLNATTNQATVKEMTATETLEADEIRFYHSLRIDLDLLKRNPSDQTVSAILNYSRSKR